MENDIIDTILSYRNEDEQWFGSNIPKCLHGTQIEPLEFFRILDNFYTFVTFKCFQSLSCFYGIDSVWIFGWYDGRY